MKYKYSLPALMFAYYASSAVLLPFFSLYLSRFLSPYEIGVLMAIIPVSMMVFQPLWGKVADRFGIKRILVLNLTMAIAATVGFFFAHSFLSLFLVLGAYSVFIVSMLPLIDTMVLSVNKENFGRIRLWGSVGYGVAAFLCGAFKTQFLGFWSFIIHMILLLAVVFIVLKMPIQKNNNRTISDSPELKQRFPFRNLRVTMVLLSSLLIGMMIKGYDTFYAVGLEQLKASDLLLGSSWVIAIIPEIVLFYLLDKIGGKMKSQWIMSIGVAMFGLRMLLLSVFPILWVWLASQPIMSMGFCFWYYGSIKSMSGMLSESQQTTGNTMLWAATYGVGGIIGSYSSGIIVNAFDIPTLFGVTALCCFISFLLSLMTRPKALRS